MVNFDQGHARHEFCSVAALHAKGVDCQQETKRRCRERQLRNRSTFASDVAGFPS